MLVICNRRNFVKLISPCHAQEPITCITPRLEQGSDQCSTPLLPKTIRSGVQRTYYIPQCQLSLVIRIRIDSRTWLYSACLFVFQGTRWWRHVGMSEPQRDQPLDNSVKPWSRCYRRTFHIWNYSGCKQSCRNKSSIKIGWRNVVKLNFKVWLWHRSSGVFLSFNPNSSARQKLNTTSLAALDLRINYYGKCPPNYKCTNWSVSQKIIAYWVCLEQ